ncbi:FAD-dependent monooxygenase [Leptolyngbya cf. ectocarpi LEGE 11479]|uniref:FAD-dependent monooxygenase n=1 Tax=Leptolyngbya cf. ectocarpi LEGE 11479 TaxID=1828722 RepID=A0A929FAB3_LEPEC|nr:FAD-dependent monooxygenase [Leptolyngbya ectocarpi]MBE9069861.1 FAD-dependent monooxygenase [Leptolyngbya cf. ectocarpi LEGE 11479]
MSSLRADVVIIGQGIAGLCLAWLLQKKGISAILIGLSKTPPMMALAETLPPSSLVLLEQLGLKALFERSALRKTYGYHSLWGTANIVDTNFFVHRPFQYGLKLDKQKLLIELGNTLAQKVLAVDRWSDFDPIQRTLRIQRDTKQETITGKIFVDATGRRRALLKALRIPTQESDQQLAFTCHLPRIRHPKIKHEVFTELFAQGWGIVSGLDEETNVLTLFTEKGSPLARHLCDYTKWKEVLTETQILQDFLVSDHAVRVKVATANSSRAAQIAGQNWLAVGDTAIAFDPLSSHGITNAVYTAWQAQEAIAQTLKSDLQTPLVEYAHTLEKIFATYLHTQRQLKKIGRYNPITG